MKYFSATVSASGIVADKGEKMKLFDKIKVLERNVMERLTKAYDDGTHVAADNLPCGENSWNYKGSGGHRRNLENC